MTAGIGPLPETATDHAIHVLVVDDAAIDRRKGRTPLKNQTQLQLTVNRYFRED